MKFRVLIAAIAIGFTGNAFAIPSCVSSASDPDGDGFGWENNASCTVTQLSTGAPVLYDLVQLRQIEFTRLAWQWNDLAGKEAYCQLEVLHNNCRGNTPPSAPYWSDIDCFDTAQFGATKHVFSANGSITNTYFSNGIERLTESGNWWLDNGFIKTNLRTELDAEYGEVKENTTFIHTEWQANNGNSRQRYRCTGVAPSATQTPTLPSTSCIDDDGDGWGWDGTNSCRTTTSTTTPTNIPSDRTCVDTDGDGWGWDGRDSCRVTDNITNPPTAECIDTPPANDGWGWDGSDSCRLAITPPDYERFIGISMLCSYDDKEANGIRPDEFARFTLRRDNTVVTQSIPNRTGDYITTWSYANGIVVFEGSSTWTVVENTLKSGDATCVMDN